MSRTVFDCARVPGSKNCSVQIVGERNDVLEAAKQHLVSHGHEDNGNLAKNVTQVVDDHQQATPYASWG